MGQTVNLLAYAFGGSNPSLPTQRCGNSSVGRARPCQGRGREFESRLPLEEQKGAQGAKSIESRLPLEEQKGAQGAKCIESRLPLIEILVR